MKSQSEVVKIMESTGLRCTKSGEWSIDFAFRPGRSLLRTALKALDRSSYGHYVSKFGWDAESIADYVSGFGVDRGKIDLQRVGWAEIPLYTRWFRRTYTVGESVKKPSISFKGGEWKTLRPVLVDMYVKPKDFAASISDVIKSNRLREYKVVMLSRPASETVGGYVGVGSLPGEGTGRCEMVRKKKKRGDTCSV